MVRSLPRPGSVLEDERGHEADQRERLGEREADPDVQRDAAGGLRLPGHGFDRVAEDQADADARADGGESVSDGAGVEADDLGRASGKSSGKRHRFSPLRVVPAARPAGWVVGTAGQCDASSELAMYVAVSVVKINACSRVTRVSSRKTKIASAKEPAA